VENYEVFEHTADIGIRVRGKDLKSLFRNASLAMFQISAAKKSTKDIKYKKISIAQEAESLDELFVNWLNELLSLSAVKGLIFDDFKINRLGSKKLEAIAVGADIKNYKLNLEIKAATYCNLKLSRTKSGWKAEVILDV